LINIAFLILAALAVSYQFEPQFCGTTERAMGLKEVAAARDYYHQQQVPPH